LQKWVIRITNGVRRYTSCIQLFEDLNILPVPCMYISEIICHMKLHIEKLEESAAIHNHNAHQKLNLRVQFCRTNALKKGVMNMEIKLYNKLPNKIMEVEKMRQFNPTYYNTYFTLQMNICHVKLVEYDI
jgi:hypothetical protein